MCSARFNRQHAGEWLHRGSNDADLDEVEVSQLPIFLFVHGPDAVAEGQAAAGLNACVFVIKPRNDAQSARILAQALDKADAAALVMLPQQRQTCLRRPRKRPLADNIAAGLGRIKDRGIASQPH